MGEMWKEKTVLMKVLSVIGIMVSMCIVVLAILHLTGVLENADNVCIPLLAVPMFIQSIENWKNSKVTSCFSLLAAVFICIVSILKFTR